MAVPFHRRWGLLISLAMITSAAGIVLVSNPLGQATRTRARRAWLASQEAEIRRFMSSGRVSPNRPGPDNWFDNNFALFDDGWAVWRLNTFHSDQGQDADWAGVGDIAVLIDGQGKAHYSRFHFCDGTLGWALGYPLSPLPPRPASIDAFLALFKPGTWTDDRPAVEAAIPSR